MSRLIILKTFYLSCLSNQLTIRFLRMNIFAPFRYFIIILFEIYLFFIWKQTTCEIFILVFYKFRKYCTKKSYLDRINFFLFPIILKENIVKQNLFDHNHQFKK